MRHSASMEESKLSSDRHTINSQNTVAPVSIVRYNIDVGSVNAQITLQQNMFSFLLEGQKSVQYATAQVKINPNQFVLLSSGNCLMTEKIAHANGRYRSILFFFDNMLLTDFFIRHPQVLHTSTPKSNDEPFLVFEKDPFLINFIESLSFIADSHHAASAEMRKVKLEELLLYLSEHYPEKIHRLRNFSDGGDEDLLVRQAITANMYTPVTVEALAFLCHMSVSTFKRRFAKIYGTSPNKWLLEKRMQKAAQLLKQREYKASEIYLELGYENLSSFIQSFKQVYGITPKQYQLSN